MGASANSAADSRAEEQARQTAEPLDVLFIMPRLVFLRFFQSSLELMIERGHNVRLLLGSSRVDDPVEREWLAEAEKRPNFVCETIDHFRSDPLRDRRIALRLGMEYVRRLAPAYTNRVAARPPRLSRAPQLVKRLARMRVFRSSAGIRSLYGFLGAIDRSLPVPSAAAAYLERVRPDVVGICDKGQPGSLSSAYVKAAQERGIPTALCVASWDNLTNRQRTPVVPHALFVWNEYQRKEAVDFHGIPPERVAITGAPRFDDWFSWPARDRTEFLSRVGLDPAKPVILWIGCALNPAETTEAEFVCRWIAALRTSDDPTLREVGVLIRPHPERFDHWLATDFSGFPNVALWPRHEMTFPIGVEAKADFYDSIYHAGAVVGINTSAMIEASIVGRPVLTLLVPEFHDSQLATFHFSYLLQSEGGPVRVAHSMADHLADLRSALAPSDSAESERVERFVASFVRPRGLDRPATEVFVETFEELARTPVDRERDPLWVLALRPLPVCVFRVDQWLRTTRKRLRPVAKRFRAVVKRIRQRQRRLAKRLKRITLVRLKKSVVRLRTRVVRLRTSAARRLRGLARATRKWWRQNGQPHLSRGLKQSDRLRLRRAGVNALLTEFRRAQPPLAIGPDYSDLLFLHELIRSSRPTTVLEFGSGCSTAVIAAALRDNGRGHLWSVESDEERARATSEALPDVLQPLVTVTHSPAIEDDRDVLGWSYEHVPPVEPDFVYLDGPPHTTERKVSFDLLDIESRLRPGCVIVVDGRGRNARYLRDHFTRDYRFVEYNMRWRHMFRYTFELLETEHADSGAEDIRPRIASAGS